MRFFILVFLLFVSLHASVMLKSGWNMVGINSHLDINASTISSTDIKIIWQYDNDLKNWKLYTNLNVDTNYSTITQLEGGDAVWILANRDFAFNNSASSIMTTPLSIDSYDILNSIVIDVSDTSLDLLSVASTDTSLAAITSDKTNGTITLTPNNKYGSAKLIVTALKAGVVESRIITLNFSPATSATVFTPVSDLLWDNLAVRKVLNTFAFGGFATDTQIQTWADMSPQDAIKEMLTFDKQNSLLSPADSNYSVPQNKSFKELQDIFGNYNDTTYPILAYHREYLRYSSWSGFQTAWKLTSNMRGFNPFRAKIGFWETNYHLALNKLNALYNHPYTQYYDDIMQSLEDGKNYEDVLSVASLSAGIAYQYGHNKNRYENGTFYGNEDFAREYHQIFFRIFGDYDPDYHEKITIKNTAKALTDMNGGWHDATVGINDGVAYEDAVLTFGTTKHYPSDLEIYSTQIAGTNAKERIEALSKIAINQTESLNNLPLFIIRSLADDNLDASKISIIQNSWKAMPNKNLLSFLQEYAVSTLFHSSSRVKYRTSIDRNIFLTNQFTLDNYESYHELNNQLLPKDGFEPFELLHDVFGHQSGKEAFYSPDVFYQVYNNATYKTWLFKYAYEEQRDSSGNVLKDTQNNSLYTDWIKHWESVIPKDTNGHYVVKDVASWLWKRFINDNERNFGTLEKAHIYALLNGKDLGYFLNPDDPEHIYTISELESFDNSQKINDASVAFMNIDSSDRALKLEANHNISRVIAFLSTLPYIFVEEGR